MTERTARRNGNDYGLAAAMALLIQTQAESVRDMAEYRKEIAKIYKELEMIQAVLVRHERILERLPEVIREKIGFKN